MNSSDETPPLLDTIFRAFLKNQRTTVLAHSPQMTVDQLRYELDACAPELPVVFDDGAYRPCGLMSWRGSYAELAVAYAPVGAPAETRGCSYQGALFSQEAWGPNYESVPAVLPDTPTVRDLFDLLTRCIGKTFTGYKGGEYVMDGMTPLWVANYGESHGWNEEHMGVVVLQPTTTHVAILTDSVPFLD